jgi:hypothetical protein
MLSLQILAITASTTQGKTRETHLLQGEGKRTFHAVLFLCSFFNQIVNLASKPD